MGIQGDYLERLEPVVNPPDEFQVRKIVIEFEISVEDLEAVLNCIVDPEDVDWELLRDRYEDLFQEEHFADILRNVIDEYVVIP